MSDHNHKVGGNGRKPGKEKPPMKIIPAPVITCTCGQTHNIMYLTAETTQVIIPCKCGALIRYYPDTSATVETIVEDGG